jgi:hypothetical protein
MFGFSNHTNLLLESTLLSAKLNGCVGHNYPLMMTWELNVPGTLQNAVCFGLKGIRGKQMELLCSVMYVSDRGEAFLFTVLTEVARLTF